MKPIYVWTVIKYFLTKNEIFPDYVSNKKMVYTRAKKKVKTKSSSQINSLSNSRVFLSPIPKSELWNTLLPYQIEIKYLINLISKGVIKCKKLSTIFVVSKKLSKNYSKKIFIVIWLSDCKLMTLLLNKIIIQINFLNGNIKFNNPF